MLHPQGISWVALAACVPAGAQRVPGAGAGSWYGRTDGWGLSLEVTHGEPPQWCDKFGCSLSISFALPAASRAWRWMDKMSGTPV